MLAKHFSRFLAADPERVHFAAHSHHYWPDVTREAQLAAWDDAARHADAKWGPFFEGPWAEARAHVARILGLSGAGASIAFAPNTHELVLRLLSCLPGDRPARVLTTDGEFHSFARQTARLEEDGKLQVARIATRPFATFEERFVAAARAGHASGAWDLVWTSQVFFDSGFAIDPRALVTALAAVTEAAIVLDGYHGFMALETDLSAIERRAFYVSGGYKYAMAGEGACFLHAPEGWFPRPPNTGWFAAFFALEGARGSGPIAYAQDGTRFMGATFDPSAIYRFNAVQRWLKAEGVAVGAIHAHAHAMQARFVEQVGRHPGLAAALPERALLVPLSEPRRGSFLTYALEGEGAKRLHDVLAAGNVLTDVRGDRLRFGFAPYHDVGAIDRGVERMAALLSR
jgi:selenocysteine lyase/cysteine desulfurase